MDATKAVNQSTDICRYCLLIGSKSIIINKTQLVGDRKRSRHYKIPQFLVDNFQYHAKKKLHFMLHLQSIIAY